MPVNAFIETVGFTKKDNQNTNALYNQTFLFPVTTRVRSVRSLPLGVIIVIVRLNKSTLSKPSKLSEKTRLWHEMCCQEILAFKFEKVQIAYDTLFKIIIKRDFTFGVPGNGGSKFLPLWTATCPTPLQRRLLPNSSDPLLTEPLLGLFHALFIPLESQVLSITRLSE